MANHVLVAMFASLISAASVLTPARADAQARAANFESHLTLRSSATLQPAPPAPSTITRASIDRAVRALPQGAGVASTPLRRAARAAIQSQPRGAGRIIAGVTVGALAGFFAGGYLGAAIDGDCGGCDDPGLLGAVIGSSTGAVAGGILGGKFLF